MVLNGLKQGAVDLRVRLYFYGEGNTLFRFPLLGGCDALAAIELIETDECGSGETTESVTLAAWEQPTRWQLELRHRHRGGVSGNVELTYHEPTKLLSFWVLQRWESARLDISRSHFLNWPSRHIWEETASDDLSRREFVPVRNNGERFIITEKGDASGRFNNTDDPEALRDIVTSHVALNHMAIGIEP